MSGVGDAQGTASLSRIAGTRSGSPPNLLLMLFGDYWIEPEAGMPSAALVTLLGDFGVNDAAARAALSRMVKRGLLASTKTGRTTAYRATTRAQQILRAASRRIAEFGDDGQAWPGLWSIVAFEIPERERSLRAAARNRLGWLGFASLYDEVWICPHDRHEAAVDALSVLGLEATAFQASFADSGIPTRMPQNAWNLAELADEYHAFIARAEAALAALAAARLDAPSALVERTRLLEDWLDLSARDPELPESILPAGWPRSRSRDLLLRAHGELGGLATERVRSVVETFELELGDLVERRTADDWTRLAG
ncbi:MAG: PaaX family transcriptional regulator C-terminal domain-containing protein [Pseudolysinimonas sp.]|uniref:PaaX family transcriptional regulator n=1 Tax=Pseudolysinimonas sp. TaxID=2680009 RepID=UPI0032676713